MKKMTGSEIRQSWIDFFVEKNHYFLQPASLIPNNDPSLLWINSGVATLKDYFSGKANPPSPRLVNSQKALRTNDFFNVGKTSRHQTFFEMLGNFSIGDYFKIEAINFAFELLIKKWEIDPNLLWITVFKDDEITYNEWIKLGINKNQIIKCGKDRNFWDVGNGPCGPCTEIYYDRGPKYDPINIGESLIINDIENDRYVEIWNIVFSQFNNDGNDNYTELLRKNIDTGAGLERIASISQDVPTNFDTDLFQNIIKEIQSFTEFKYDVDAYFGNNEEQTKINFYYKVITDHLRASVFAIADGAIPSNKDRGYVLRRLIRRAIVFLNKLKINDKESIIKIIDSIINTMQPFYSYLLNERNNICDVILHEYAIFNATLSQGLKIINNAITNNSLNNETVFNLVTTYGFPIESIKEIANENGLEVDEEEYKRRFAIHQKVSQSNRQEIAMDSQNNSLISLNVDSKFHYDKHEMDAKVIKLYDDNFNEVNELNDEDGYVIFDNTVFYATSGGQIHDTGLINDKYFVDNVIKAPGFQHVHHVINAKLKIDQIVHLAINKEDRKINMAHHTSEHLLQSALINNINSNVKQLGAFKSPEKFTFDFQNPTKLSDEQLTKIVQWVNNVIKQNIPVKVLMMTLDEAKKSGAIGHFEDVYKKIQGLLRVIKVGDVSIELCGGTHVSNTSDIEQFAIISHYSRRAGEWRIEAISTNKNIQKYSDEYHEKLFEIYQNELNSFKKMNFNTNELEEIYKNWKEKFSTSMLWKYAQYLNDFKNDISLLKNKLIKDNLEIDVVNIKNEYNKISSKKIYCVFNEKYSIDAINSAVIELSNENKENIYVAISINNEKMQYIVITNKNSGMDVQPIIQKINEISGGKGAGKTTFARGGASDISKLENITNWLNEFGFNHA